MVVITERDMDLCKICGESRIRHHKDVQGHEFILGKKGKFDTEKITKHEWYSALWAISIALVIAVVVLSLITDNRFDKLEKWASSDTSFNSVLAQEYNNARDAVDECNKLVTEGDKKFDAATSGLIDLESDATFLSERLSDCRKELSQKTLEAEKRCYLVITSGETPVVEDATVEDMYLLNITSSQVTGRYDDNPNNSDFGKWKYYLVCNEVKHV